MTAHCVPSCLNVLLQITFGGGARFGTMLFNRIHWCVGTCCLPRNPSGSSSNRALINWCGGQGGCRSVFTGGAGTASLASSGITRNV